MVGFFFNVNTLSDKFALLTFKKDASCMLTSTLNNLKLFYVELGRYQVNVNVTLRIMKIWLRLLNIYIRESKLLDIL